jgi:hypothetical protein
MFGFVAAWVAEAATKHKAAIMTIEFRTEMSFGLIGDMGFSCGRKLNVDSLNRQRLRSGT